jgi:hypothetical protein
VALLGGALLFAPALTFAEARADDAKDADPVFVRFLLDLGLPAEAGREAARLGLVEGARPLPSKDVARVGLALLGRSDALGAATQLTLAAELEDDARVADEHRLIAAVALLKARAFPQAIALLSRLEAFGSEPGTRERAFRLRCIGHAFASDAGAARECVPRLLPPAEAARAAPLLERLAIDPDRRAIVGGALSVLVPGLGQATAGDPGDGALALLVNGAWGVGGTLLILDAAILDAVILGAGVGIRYYVGNVMNGAKAWRTTAERTRETAAADLMRLLAP